MSVTWSEITRVPRYQTATPEEQQKVKSYYFDNFIIGDRQFPQQDIYKKWKRLFGESHPEAQRIRQSKLTPTPLEVEKQPGFEFTQPKSLVDQYIGDLVKSKPRSVV
ncbi:MAG: hypothetical protein ABIJ40_09825, partial [Bacteroidota bacterium]